MESISLQQLRIVEETLRQIRESIHNLEVWNESLVDVQDFYTTPEGVKTLAADCMLIEAIGEGIKKIDEHTQGLLLPSRPEIPWKGVKGMRDRIAYGYFDINSDYVWDVIKNDLLPLRDAIDYFIANLYEIVPFEE
jgi:uncharacterized protein with HEPN domain